MSKRKTARLQAGQSGKARELRATVQKVEDSKGTPRHSGHGFSAGSIRETIESVVVAFVLAFLFRTFEAEAFVIPTGSMAPTLMGCHKDLDCPKCGYRYQVGNSSAQSKVEACTCPMCMFPTDLSSSNAEGKVYETYNGDRILVNKFCYEYEAPKRWDVAVFKFPADAPTNYIKRVVGLPGDTLKISNGDIFVWNKDENRFVIERKPPNKQLAMLQMVFDNDVMDRIAEYGWPERWNNPSDNLTDLSAGETAGQWITSKDYRSFSVDGSAADEAWMRYEHRIPDAEQWAWVRKGNAVPPSLVPPRKITDLYAYNSGRFNTSGLPNLPMGPNWVGDLTLGCQIDVESDSGGIVLELVEGGRRFQCRINVADGKATMSIDNLATFAPTANTNIRAFGSHKIVFANCDDQLRLWIDGNLVEFDAETTYAPLDNVYATDADRSPVGVGSQGVALRVSHLEILRDIYYITNPETNGLAINPAGQRYATTNRETPGPEYVLEDDQFFMLGDNSPRSKDGRFWGFVPRKLMIGKAVFIYWPHSWDRLPGTGIPFPFFPNFPDMELVR